MPLHSLRLWSCVLLALCACVAVRPAQPTATVARWKERIYRPTPESVSIPYPEEVVITIPDEEF
ncbi:hypothetical protein [Myxococcus qinghaiensis]|uniref:hypothetical protein n=1 Tax=Myxococcus qinghaiensis TaxID=2906758 RepID=UPI0020A7231B|nr:hypothetical protein [Myxococcus qinghaiensis]MCP3167816.1 hypothetical protein [Myxococcus qinghaiensis]